MQTKEHQEYLHSERNKKKKKAQTQLARTLGHDKKRPKIRIHGIEEGAERQSNG
jgi:hypothetical protein